MPPSTPTMLGAAAGAVLAGVGAVAMFKQPRRHSENRVLASQLAVLRRVADVCDTPSAARAVLTQVNAEVSLLNRWVAFLSQKQASASSLHLTDMQCLQDIANSVAKLVDVDFPRACGNALAPVVQLDLDTAGRNLVRETARTVKAIEGRLTNVLRVQWQLPQH